MSKVCNRTKGNAEKRKIKEKLQSLCNKGKYSFLNRGSNILYIDGYIGNIIKSTFDRYFVF